MKSTKKAKAGKRGGAAKGVRRGVRASAPKNVNEYLTAVLKPARRALREMQAAIGQQLLVIFQLPQEIAPELNTLASRIDKERTDRYADIVGTC